MIPAEFFVGGVSVARIMSHIRMLEGVRHPVAAPESLERAADHVAASLDGMGYAVDEHRFPENGRYFRNVIATRQGSLRPQECVALLAHYDTVATTPGADDNASGVAALLEAAALLAPLRFERTVRFIAVSLEENRDESDPDSGLRGSRALAAHVLECGWELRSVIVFESVGYAGEKVVQSAPAGVPVHVPETGDFIAVIGNERSKELTNRFPAVTERLGMNLPCVTLTAPGNGETLPDTRRSDHAPFWDAGIPAIMLTDTTNFRNPHYHQPTDTIETLNPEFAGKVCCAAAALAAEEAVPFSR